ncbi:MAG: hypothetical protein MJ025_02250 [Victivallaceae bacterium]|nr:hypothetical protein [Victivallaceae bacterium]
MTALLLIYNYPALAIYTFSEQMKMVVDSSMATILLFSFLCSIICAYAAVGREMRDGTVLTLLSKPVGIFQFAVGKTIGVSLAALWAAATCSAGTIISVYVAVDQFRLEMTLFFVALGSVFAATLLGLAANYLRGASFSEASCLFLLPITIVLAISAWTLLPAPEIMISTVVRALIVLMLSVPVFATLSGALAIRHEFVQMLVIGCAVFVLGMMSSYLFSGRGCGPLTSFLSNTAYAFVPNWQFFWVADAVAMNRPIPWRYMAKVACYSAVMSALIMFWTGMLLGKSEVGSERHF